MKSLVAGVAITWCTRLHMGRNNEETDRDQLLESISSHSKKKKKCNGKLIADEARD